jgi:hypothetical protein
MVIPTQNHDRGNTMTDREISPALEERLKFIFERAELQHKQQQGELPENVCALLRPLPPKLREDDEVE